MPQLPRVPRLPNPQMEVAVPRTGAGVAYDQLPATKAAVQQAAGETVGQAGQSAVRMINSFDPQIDELGMAAMQVAQAVGKRQAEEQDKEDWIAGAMARAQFYQQADELFNQSEKQMTSKEGFMKFAQDLNDLQARTVQGYTGSDAGRMKLMGQLADGRTEYARNALRIRSAGINDLVDNELATTQQRLATKAYEMPSTLGDQFAAADAVVGDAAMVLGPQKAAEARAKLHANIMYSAIDGRLNFGDTASAEALLSSPQVGVLEPQMRSQLDRRLRELKAQGAGGADSWSAGTGGVITNKATGEQRLPGSNVQTYYKDLAEAGRTSSTVNVQNAVESQFAKDRATAFTKQLDMYTEQQRTTNTDLQRARQIDKLLEGVPTGNLPADAQFQLSKFFGVTPEKVANREAADSLTGELMLEIVRKLAPVTADDRKFAMNISQGAAQTPAGRKKMLYLMERKAQFDQSMGAAAARAERAVANGTMDSTAAMQKLNEWERLERERFAADFNPPQFKD